jgi:endonuclease III-like uncharacterized protein
MQELQVSKEIKEIKKHPENHVYTLNHIVTSQLLEIIQPSNQSIQAMAN